MSSTTKTKGLMKSARLQLMLLYGGPSWIVRTGRHIRVDKEELFHHTSDDSKWALKMRLKKMEANNLITNLTWDAWHFYFDLVLPDWLHYDKTEEEEIRDNFLSRA